LKEETRLRFVFLSIVLVALAANQPCVAKEAHGQHGSHAGVANNSAKTKTANPAESKANGAVSAEPTISPPVLPPRGAEQQNRTINSSVKIVPPAARGQAAETTTPTVRNAIGQPMVQSKALAWAQPHLLPALQAPGAVPPILRGAPPGPPPVVSSNVAHSNAPAVNVANVANRGSVNGAAVIRPAAASTAIGGAVRPNYGINGTTAQNRR
jgi:hypothetical protein